MNRQKRILAWLLALLCATGLYAWWATPVVQQTPTTAVGRSSGGARAERSADQIRAASDVRTLHLDLLAGAGSSAAGVERDLFAFKVPPPPVFKPPPAPRIERPVPPPPPVVPVETGPVAERFDFLGSLRKDGRQLVFLINRQEIYLVAEGQQFGPNNEFHLAQVGETAVQIEQRGISQPISVSVSDPQSASGSAAGSGPGRAFDAPVETVPQPVEGFRRTLPRMRRMQNEPVAPQ